MIKRQEKFMKKRRSIFISYSRRDHKWLERLNVHLRPLERELKIDIWQDTRIKPGSKWREEIQRALSSAKIAILLISADFLASDFIANNELPPLLKAAEDGGAVILPIIVSPSLFMYHPDLSRFQAVNPPSESLVLLDKGGQEEVFVKVAELIYTDIVQFYEEDENANIEQDRQKTENFLTSSCWNKLLKIGSWILDTKNSKFVGAGMNSYILSRNEFGDSAFTIRSKLKFSNFEAYKLMDNGLGFNGGIVCGWRSEKSNPRYYHILLTGREVEFEQIGFNGRDAFRDFKTLSAGCRLDIAEDTNYALLIKYENQRLALLVDDKLICSFDVPGVIAGRVGIRPWRSQVDCIEFEVSEE